MPALVFWDGGGDNSNWQDALNWSNDALPGVADDVVITGSGTVNFSAGTSQVFSVVSDRALTLSAGQFSAGTLQVNNSLIFDGTIHVSDTRVLAGTGSASVSLINGSYSNLRLDVAATALGNLHFYQSLSLYARLSLNGGANFHDVMSVMGTGDIFFTGGSSVFAVGDGTASGAAQLTIAPTIAIRGTASGQIVGFYSEFDQIINQGTIETTTSSQFVRVKNITNEGTLRSASGTLDLADDWTNSGSIIVTSGTLYLGGSFTQAGLGGFSRSGGTVIVTGMLSGDLALSSATGSWQLAGTLKDSTYTSANGAVLSISSLAGFSPSFDNVTLGSNLSITRNLQIYTNLNLASRTLTTNSRLTFHGHQSLSIAGTIHSTATGSATVRIISSSLDISAGVLFTGGNFDFTGNIVSFAELLINSASRTVSIDGYVNQGVIHLAAGTLAIKGNYTASTLGIINRTGGTVSYTGTYDGDLALTAATGSWNFSGRLKNSRYTSDSVGLLNVTGSSVFENVVLGSNLSIGAFDIQVVTALQLDHSHLSLSSTSLNGSGLIGGPGELLVSGTTEIFTSDSAGPSQTLTLGSDLIIRNSGTLTIHAPDAIDQMIIAGTVESIGASSELTISNVENDGLIRINDRHLKLGDMTQADVGIVEVTTGSINITGTLFGDLSLDSASPVWNLYGTLKDSTLTLNATSFYTTGLNAVFDNVILGTDLTTKNHAIIKNGINLNGHDLILGGTIRAEGSQSIVGIGEIRSNGTTSEKLFVDTSSQSPGYVLGVGPGVLVRNVSLDADNASTIVSSATVIVDASWANVVLSGVTNSGSILLEDGALSLEGSILTSLRAGSGLFERTGGRLILIDSYEGDLVVDEFTGDLELSGAIKNGQVSTVGSHAFSITGASSLENVTLNADVICAANMAVYGDLEINGRLQMNDGFLYLNDSQSQTIHGIGIIETYGETHLRLSNGIVGNGITIRSHGDLIINYYNPLGYQDPTPVVSYGTIEAAPDGGITFFYLTNLGVIRLEGVVNFFGPVTQQIIGALENFGGTVNIAGTLSGDVHLTEVTGSWTLNNPSPSSFGPAIYENGMLTTAGNASIIVEDGEFSNVVVNGNVTVTGSLRSEMDLHVYGGTFTLIDGVVYVPSSFEPNTGNLILEGGRLRGSGTISGSLRNFAIVEPGMNGMGSLTVNGIYEQGASAKVLIVISSPSNAGKLVVSNSSTVLDGSLEVIVTGPDIPAGTSFVVLDTNSTGSGTLSFIDGNPNDLMSFSLYDNGVDIFVTANAATYRSNLLNPGLVDVAYHGTAGADVITLTTIDSTTIHVTGVTGSGASIDETLVGVTGDVYVLGHSGGDTIDASALGSRSVVLEGGAGSDLLRGGHGDDKIYGDGDGGEGDADWIEGGQGNDVIWGDGAEGSKLEGSDTISGGDGDDLINSDGAEGTGDLIYGDDGSDTINAGAGADTIDGGSGDDLVDTGEGSDQADGGDDHDILLGGIGGGSAADTLNGGGGRDILIGDMGVASTVDRAGGKDSLSGGVGEDIVILGVVSPIDASSLMAIQSEWLSERSYSERVANIRGTGLGPRLNGNSFFVAGGNTFDDRSLSTPLAVDLADIAIGGSDLDWFFINEGEDIAIDVTVEEIVESLSAVPSPY